MKVLYITPYVPYESIPHAGGAFFYRYLKGLSKTINVTILAPDTAENIQAINHLDGEFTIYLVGKEVKRTLVDRILFTVPRMVVHPLTFIKWWEEALKEKILERDFINQFDMIELQWSQMLPLASVIKKANPSIPVISFEHDVFTQSVHRRALEATFSKNKVENLLRLIRVKRMEKEALNQCDAVFVFSEKDKRLLEEMKVHAQIYPLSPSLDIPDEVSTLCHEPPICLFVGAMDRVENSESVIWFIRKVWPLILSQVPDVQLQVVGAHPPQEVLDLADENIVVTGFVEDILPYYKGADVFMAPMLTGAGVKFKILQALAFGLPVVTTKIGAEGIDDKNEFNIFPCITDDPETFAKEAVHLLRNEGSRKKVGARGRQWILERYDFQKNTIDRALQVYYKIVDEKRTGRLEE